MKTTKIKKLTINDAPKEEKERKSKKVVIDVSERQSTATSLIYLTPYERMMREIQKVLATRDQMAVYENIDNNMVNLTPKLLHVSNEEDDFFKLERKYSFEHIELPSFRSFTSSLMRQRSSRGLGYHLSLEDIMTGIGTDRLVLDDATPLLRMSWPSATASSSDSTLSVEAPTISTVEKAKRHRQLIRIVLRKTDLILLYEKHGNTSIKNTEDGNYAEMDNREYDYLTIGSGKVRRRSEAETQTLQDLFKSREVNTELLQTKNIETFVSHYELFDTYKRLDDTEYGSLDDDNRTLGLRFSDSDSKEKQFSRIGELPSFQLAGMVIGRLLAGNIYEEDQKRFRNMIKISKRVKKIYYKYTLKTLFILQPHGRDNERRAVSDMSFCPTNGDILAVGYGIYSYKAAKLSTTGEVCIWSIKNPCDPERFYSYTEPVISVEFSPFNSTLLAIGLLDGSIEVRNIGYFNQPPVAISRRTYAAGVDPVLAIKWFQQSTSNHSEEIDPFLALAEDSTVTQFRIINSPHLSSFKLMSLKRLEGNPEGLAGAMPSTDVLKLSHSYPQGLNLIQHPSQSDIYYILTDEGCIHKCSVNYRNQSMEALKTHEASVNHMDFSPWSPLIFLTCGNDWCLRIWMDGISEPLVTLKNIFQPYNWAAWSRTNSTILLAIGPLQCDIWDIGRNILKPVSSQVFTITSHNTTGIFSLDGHSFLVGNERGQVFVNALDEMPFPPHYQYEALEKSIYNAVNNYPDLIMQLKSIGYFGYPNRKSVKLP